MLIHLLHATWEKETIWVPNEDSYPSAPRYTSQVLYWATGNSWKARLYTRFIILLCDMLPVYCWCLYNIVTGLCNFNTSSAGICQCYTPFGLFVAPSTFQSLAKWHKLTKENALAPFTQEDWQLHLRNVQTDRLTLDLKCWMLHPSNMYLFIILPNIDFQLNYGSHNYSPRPSTLRESYDDWRLEIYKVKTITH